MCSDWIDLITCLTRFFDEETRKIPTVCSPNCSKCRIHIMTTVGTQGEETEPARLSSAISSIDSVSNTPEELWRRKSKRLSVEPLIMGSWIEPKLARLSDRLALLTGLNKSSSWRYKQMYRLNFHSKLNVYSVCYIRLIFQIFECSRENGPNYTASLALMRLFSNVHPG